MRPLAAVAGQSATVLRTVEILKNPFGDGKEIRRAGAYKPTRPPFCTNDRGRLQTATTARHSGTEGDQRRPLRYLRRLRDRPARPPRLPEHRGWHRGTERVAAAACCASRRTGGRPDRRAREAGDRAPHRREESVNLRHARQAQKVKNFIDNITG